MSDKVKAKAKTGVYVGKEIGGGVREFLGIPYAKTPARWKRAEKLEESGAEIPALECGPACTQHICREEFPVDPPMSEDCLTLNIWTSGLEGKKPVYVWIHGGCYQTGSNRTDCFGGIYCGDKFVENNPDLVYVNINYRIGPLGSMDLSRFDKTGEYADSKNLQILDVMRALEWVHENIAAFGGDPDHVTIGGQSAGSYTTCILMAIPEAVRCFQGAIAESTAPTNATMKDEEMAKMAADIFLDFAKVDSLEELLAISDRDLVEIGDQVMKNGAPFAFEPCRDDVLIPIDIEGAWRSGMASHVKVLSGTVAGEFSTDMIPMSAEEIEGMVHEIYPDLTQKQIDSYLANVPGRSAKEAMEDLHNDCGLRAAQLICSERIAEGGSEVWLYYIAFKPEGAGVRAQHCFEIPMITYKPEAEVYLIEESGEKLLGEHPDPVMTERIQGTWSAFIRSWNPECPAVGLAWPKYSSAEKNTMVIDKEWKVTGEVRPEDTTIARLFN